jgi:N-acetylglucosaminyl-diphospho-decaprenol L-rhamnosyltransferase
MNIFKDITLIYVAHKSDSIIKKNIDIIKLFNVIIVDNSNSSDLKNYLSEFVNITFINSPNLGFGHANNLAVNNAQTPYIFIVSPDIFFTISSLEILYNEFLSYKNAGVAGPSLFDVSNIRRSNSSLSFLKKKIYRNSFQRKIYKNIDQTLADGNISCDYIIGCSMLFKKSFFLDIGGFDEHFFIYYEDNDICDRIRSRNKMVLEIPSSKMIHLQGKSTKADFKINTLLSITHKISEYKYLRKNITLIKLFIIIFINALDFTQRIVINLLLFRFKMSYKNVLRLISIFLYITRTYKLIKY